LRDISDHLLSCTFNRGVLSFLFYHGHYTQQFPVRQFRQLLGSLD
jgi:hypothetical protein